MECLGLHNKPKAVVHLGHLLTGPKEEEQTQNTSKRYFINHSNKL
jgi:hypothetical protein